MGGSRSEPEALLGRRGLLLAGAAGLLAGCSSTSPSGHASSPAGSASGTPSPAQPSSRRAPRPPRPGDWDRLARHVTGPLRRPGDRGYDRVRLVQNPRYDDNHPLAVLTVADPGDVATALSFARDHDVPVSLRSGGHSYPGWSAGGAAGTGVPPSLVIDCRALHGVRLHGDGTARIGAGAALAPVYAAVGGRGRAIAGGSCATVGIGGLTLGGGVGVLTRAMGLTCDAVRSLQVVTADSRVRRVDAHHDPDLFWALRGGGGGHLGVVTSFDLQTAAAPTVHTFYLSWPLADARAVVRAWQGWAPAADHRLWSTCKLLGGQKHPQGPTILVDGTWTGPAAGLDRRLAGLLDHCPPPDVRSVHTHSYRDQMLAYAGCSAIPVSRCHTGPGGSLQREAFAATSHVGYRELGSAGLTRLLDHVEHAQSTRLREAGISMDALGGRVRDLAPGETAFVHRHALMTVQYTATYAGDLGKQATHYVRAFRDAMVPSWGDHAYVNYADAAVRNYRRAYFGANAPRLGRVRRQYDPHGLFTQPQDF